MDEWYFNKTHAPETPFVDPSMRKWLVGFFGASFVHGREEYAVRRRIRRHLELLYWQGHRHFFVGVCAGFSLLVMEEILKFRNQHTPCYLFLLEPQRIDMNTWVKEEIAAYEVMREQANQIISVSVYPNSKPSWLNQRLLSYCGRLVYYFSDPNGNTAQTVAYADELNVYTEHLIGSPDSE